MGHVILGLEHASTGNWKHESHRLLDILRRFKSVDSTKCWHLHDLLAPAEHVGLVNHVAIRQAEF